MVGVAPLGADAVHLDFDEPSQDRADADAGEASGVEERPEEATQGSSVLSDDHDEDDLPLPLPEEEEDEAVVAKAKEVIDPVRAEQRRSFGKDTLDGYALNLREQMRLRC